MAAGKFYIVNVGAGAKDNVTLKGYRLIQQADVVIVSESQRERFATEIADKQILDGGHGLFASFSRPPSDPQAKQQLEDNIRRDLGAAYRAGKTIVLIESGDIAIFSPYRGFLSEFAYMQPVLVPGISSFNAANAALGQTILTERYQQLQLSGLDAIMQSDGHNLPDTWVLFCMHLDLPELINKIQQLYAPDKNMAFILKAGYPDCQVIKTKVGNLDQYVNLDIFWPHCLIYIGI